MINKKHPKYKEYIEKCKDLAERQEAEADSIPYLGGQDGPLVDVYRKYSKKLKKLQKDYAFLFVEDGTLHDTPFPGDNGIQFEQFEDGE